MNSGDTATMTPTLEALVMVSAMFSMKKYSVTPVAPAAANNASVRQPMKGVTLRCRMHSAQNPNAKRRKRISMGDATVSSTFVETNVMPHTSTVAPASRCPRALPAPGAPVSVISVAPAMSPSPCIPFVCRSIL